MNRLCCTSIVFFLVPVGREVKALCTGTRCVTHKKIALLSRPPRTRDSCEHPRGVQHRALVRRPARHGFFFVIVSPLAFFPPAFSLTSRLFSSHLLTFPHSSRFIPPLYHIVWDKSVGFTKSHLYLLFSYPSFSASLLLDFG